MKRAKFSLSIKTWRVIHYLAIAGLEHVGAKQEEKKAVKTLTRQLARAIHKSGYVIDDDSSDSK